jgi:putative ABC transport system permease protein
VTQLSLNQFAGAARSLRRNPALTLTAIVTLALGIGASVAIFSVANAVLLRPLPYANPRQLVVITSDFQKRDARDLPVVPGDLKELRASSVHLAGIAGVQTTRQALIGDDGKPEQVNVANVTTNLFSLLGARVAAGRDFADGDGVPAPTGAMPAGAAPPAPPAPIVILSYEFWQRRFGGDTSILNRSVTLGAARALVVGVAPPGFELLFSAAHGVERKPEVYTALRLDWDNASRTDGILNLIGRLREGATAAQAQADVDAVASELRSRFQVKETAGMHFRAEPMAADLVKEVRPAVVALTWSGIFVLLIACVNVAGLLLVRASFAAGEHAVRAALGESAMGLAQLAMAESLLLSAAGAVVGLALVVPGIRIMQRIAPEGLPRLDAVTIDATVLGFTLLLMLAATGLLGIVPALRASRPDLMSLLRPAGRIGSRSMGKALRYGAVIVEVALAYSLLVGCGLMVRSYVNITHASAGYDPNGLLTFSLRNGRLKTPAEKQAFSEAVRDRLAAIPGVVAVTAAFPLPLDGNNANLRWGTEAAAADPAKFKQGGARFVLPGYFDAMHTRVIAGRTFTDADNIPGAKVVVIDRILAEKAFPGETAVGKRLLSRFRTPEPEAFDVIGVVDHQRHETLAHDGRETLYFADGMIGHGFASRWAVRTNDDPAKLAPLVRAAVAAVDPMVPVAELKPMSDYVRRSQAPTTFALVCISIFAVIAALLAAVGLYGTLSLLVRQRTTELGVRMALGASRGRIFAIVIGRGLALTAIGIAIGLGLALSLTRVIRSLLVGVEATDVLTFVVISLAFAALAAFACWIPARRAASLDAAGALRVD